MSRYPPSRHALRDLTMNLSDEDDPFSPATIKKLIDHLEEQPLPHLTPSENASLLVLIQTALEVRQFRTAISSPADP